MTRQSKWLTDVARTFAHDTHDLIVASPPRCAWCGQRNHAPDNCPNRTKCKHGVYEDLEDNGIPRCTLCAIA